MAEEATAPTGALSVEQAAEALSAAREVDPAISAAARTLSRSRRPAATAQAEPTEEQEPQDLAPEGDGEGDTESEAVTTADEALEPEEAIEGEEEDELESEPEAPAIAAPHSWSAEDKEVFATLTPKAQEIILARETARDTATSKALQEAAAARKAAEHEVQQVTVKKAGIEALIVKAEATFKDQPSVAELYGPKMASWATFDWHQAAADDPAGLAALQAQYQSDQIAYNQLLQDEAAQKANLASLKAAQADAENLEFQNHLRTEAAKLPDLAPDLVDEKEGPARRKAVGSFLQQAGVPPEALSRISALELALAYDAMRFRQAQAKAKAPAPAKPAATQPPAQAERRPVAVRPGAAQVQRPASQRQASAALAKLTQTGSIEDAVAYLKAKG